MEKKDDETWLDAARREAKEFGLIREVTEFYHSYVKLGYSDCIAAQMALNDWVK